MSNFFAMINRMKLIDRWALMRNTSKENIAEHSHNVAIIAHALCTIGNKKFGKNYNAENAHCLRFITMPQRLSPAICQHLLNIITMK